MKLPLHGRSHRHNGSDPIGTFIKLKWPDTGAFIAQDNSSSNFISMTGGATGDLQLISGSGGFNFQTIGQAEIGAEHFDFNASGTGFNVIAAGAFTVRADDGGVQLTIHKAGDTFTVKNHSGNAKIQWTEGDADLHIPSGGTIIADL